MAKDKKAVALILAQMKPPHAREEREEEGEQESMDEDHLLGIADELIGAVKSGDRAAVAEALRGAFTICDSEPHVEGKHLEDEESEESEESEGYEEAEHYAQGGMAYGKDSLAKHILRRKQMR